MRNLAEHPSRSTGFLSRYHDRDLAADERLAFERHVAECRECAEAVVEYEAILALYRESGTEPADAALAGRISRRIDTELRRRPPVKFLSLEIDLLWASVAAIGLVAAIALFAVLGRKPAPASMAEYGPGTLRPATPAAPERAPAPPAASEARERPDARTETDADRPSAPEAGNRNAPTPRDAKSGEERVPGGVAAGVVGGVAGGAAAAEPAAPVPGPLAKSTPRASDRAPLEAGDENAAPVPLRRPEPVLPDSVRRSLSSSPVVVEAVISAEGDVTSARIVRSNPAADRAVLEALRRWKYRPAIVGGEPHAARLTVTFRGE